MNWLLWAVRESNPRPSRCNRDALNQPYIFFLIKSSILFRDFHDLSKRSRWHTADIVLIKVRRIQIRNNHHNQSYKTLHNKKSQLIKWTDFCGRWGSRTPDPPDVIGMRWTNPTFSFLSNLRFFFAISTTWASVLADRLQFYRHTHQYTQFPNLLLFL